MHTSIAQNLGVVESWPVACVVHLDPSNRMFCSMYDIVIPASPVRPLGIGPAWYLLRAWLPMTDLFSFLILFPGSIPRLRLCSPLQEWWSLRVWHAFWVDHWSRLLYYSSALVHLSGPRVALGLFFFTTFTVPSLHVWVVGILFWFGSVLGPVLDAPLLRLILHQWHAPRWLCMRNWLVSVCFGVAHISILFFFFFFSPSLSISLSVVLCFFFFFFLYYFSHVLWLCVIKVNLWYPGCVSKWSDRWMRKLKSFIPLPGPT